MESAYWLIFVFGLILGSDGYGIHEKRYGVKDGQSQIMNDVVDELVNALQDLELNDAASKSWQKRRYRWIKESCYWKNANHGKGNWCDFLNGEVAVGSCQSGGKQDCKDYGLDEKFSTRILCCKKVEYDINKHKVGVQDLSRWKRGTYNCGWWGDEAGKKYQCRDQTVVVGICGSGAKKDCKTHKQINPYGPQTEFNFHHLAYCCWHDLYPHVWKVVNNIECEWYGAKDWGSHLTCPNDKVMVGECGSGYKKDCEGNTHMIRCCPFEGEQYI